MTNPSFSLEKVRHPIKMRMLQVERTSWITPFLLSVTLTGDDLEDFISLSFNDHVKLFFPEKGVEKPILPTLNPNGSLDTSNMQGTVTRDFTPRHYDAQKKALEIQFFIHNDNDPTTHGHASHWAIHAKPGDFIGVGGPKGSLMIPTQFDWFLMLGDETAIPAISRRLEELPAEATVTVMIETAYPQRIAFKSQAKQLDIRWIDKDKETLIQEVMRWIMPNSEGFIWAAGEFSSMKEIYNHLLSLNTIDKSHFKVSSYWKKGESNVHGTFGKS